MGKRGKGKGNDQKPDQVCKGWMARTWGTKGTMQDGTRVTNSYDSNRIGWGQGRAGQVVMRACAKTKTSRR